MNARPVAIPEDLHERVPRWFGEDGRRWLAELTGVATRLADRWGLRLGPPYAGGTHALVLSVIRADDSPAVLKLPFVDDENYAEADALRAYDGDGAARLLAYDPPTGALLLERVAPGDPLLDHPDRGEALRIACGLLRRLRRPVPDPDRFPAATAVARRWATRFPEQQRRLRVPGADELVARASETAARYASDPEGPALLVNRDVHLSNVLRAEREPWLLIDPKPVVGEAAFEAGFPVAKSIEGGPDPAEVDRAVDQFAVGLDVAPDRVRGWALVRAVEEALWVAEVGGDPAGFIAGAAALARPV